MTLPLEPDRSQIEIFTAALFCHAGGDGFVSVRAFYEDDSSKPFRITPTSMKGGLAFLNEAAIDDARRAAQSPKKVVFCPPLAVFSNNKRAREIDIAEGLVLSIECDSRPQEAQARLESILGPATVVVRSGGTWTDPQTGEVQDKLHLHWRLRSPARGKDEIAKLKQARNIATRIVGGDPTNKPVCHPIRWPGSWHRKAAPILCSIASADRRIEIDLEIALMALLADAAKIDDLFSPNPTGNGQDKAPPTEWAELMVGIVSSSSYHDTTVRLAAKLLRSGMSDGAAVNTLRAWMDVSTGPRDERWQTRYDDIPRSVSTAREKIAPAQASVFDDMLDPHAGGQYKSKKSAELPEAASLELVAAEDVEITAIEWLWQNRFAIGKVSLLAGLPDKGKSQITCDVAARVTTTTGDKKWPCGEGIAPIGNVIMFSAEDDPADTLVPRLLAAGADLTRVKFVKMVKTKPGSRRMFDLAADLEQLRNAVTAVGDVIVVIFDPLNAYFGHHGRTDTFRGSDVRAVLGPLAELAAELKIAILGLLHFNKKTDVTNIMLRISDSIAFVTAARAVYAVIPDDENKRTLLVRGKNNLAPATLDKTLAYTITVANVGNDPETGAVITAPHVLWFPKHVDITPSEAMQAAADDRSPGQIEAAVHFLEDLLSEGAVENSEVEEAAEVEKIAERTLRRASTKLEIEKRKQKGIKDGKWYWRLPNKGHPWPWEVEKDSDKIRY
jgi:hypothetical protein